MSDWKWLWIEQVRGTRWVLTFKDVGVVGYVCGDAASDEGWLAVVYSNEAHSSGTVVELPSVEQAKSYVEVAAKLEWA